MANLRKRGPSQWQAQVRVCGYPNQTKTFDTRAAAERWAKATEVEMAQGAFLSRRSVPKGSPPSSSLSAVVLEEATQPFVALDVAVHVSRSVE